MPGGADSRLRVLHAVAAAVEQGTGRSAVEGTLRAVATLTGRGFAALHVAATDGSLRLAGEHGLGRFGQAAAVVPAGGVPGRVLATGGAVSVARAPADHGLLAAVATARATPIGALLSVPVRGGGRTLGALTLGRLTARPFAGADRALATAVAALVGPLLDAVPGPAPSVAGEALLRAGKLAAVGQLVAGVAHQVNNPLTAILGQAHLLLMRQDVPEALRERLQIIAEETGRAAATIQALLMFSRPHPPERRPSSLAEQARRVLDLRAHALYQGSVRVVIELEDTGPVCIDENEIQHVLLALVENALQSMARQAGERVLTVRGGRSAGRAFLEVLDTGEGIAAVPPERLFEPFFSTRDQPGLGLALARAIVQEHGGTLRAAGRPAGGAAFTIELPAGERPAS